MDQIYPEFFARFYDIIYHHARDGVDNQFYLDRIKEAGGKVLEAGTGTGRLFTEALRNGADIHGIDISPSMIEVCKKKLSSRDQKRISHQNITDFKFDHKFDLIIAPFRVFMHLAFKNDQMKALNNVHKHLNPGGKFIFDVFIPDLSQLIKGLDNLVDFEGEYEPGLILKRTVTTIPDLINQIINITFKIEWYEGTAMKKEEWLTSLRYFFRFELEHLIERSEFKNYRIEGDFHGNKPDNDSKEYVITCLK
jgi:SAM-dependent methyltransferase